MHCAGGEVKERVWRKQGMRGGVVGSAVLDKAVTLLLINLHPSSSMQTVVENRSAGPFFAEPGRFEWCRSSAAGMCSEYSPHR